VVVSTTSSTALDAQRPDKRPRRQDADADEARPAASECSEIIGGGARPRPAPAEVEASESSCLGSVLESDLACPEHLADDADTTDYSSACCDCGCEFTQSDAEEVLSAPSPGDAFDSLTPLIDLTSPYSSSSDDADEDDDDDAAPSLTFSFFLDYAQQFIPCPHPKSHAVPDAAMPEVSGSALFLSNLVQIEPLCKRSIPIRCLVCARGSGSRTLTTRRATSSSGCANGAE
jgi:hypothetical protein